MTTTADLTQDAGRVGVVDAVTCTLEITGMTCASCVRRIEKRLRQGRGRRGRPGHLATEVATVTYDPTAVDVDELVGAVTTAGYGARPMPETEDHGPVASAPAGAAHDTAERDRELTAGSGRGLTPAVVAAVGTGFVLALVAFHPAATAPAGPGRPHRRCPRRRLRRVGRRRPRLLPARHLGRCRLRTRTRRLRAGRPTAARHRARLAVQPRSPPLARGPPPPPRRRRPHPRGAGVYAVRASVQATLYASNQPERLALTKLCPGWPPTVAAAAVRLAWLRQQHTTGRPVREHLIPSSHPPPR